MRARQLHLRGASNLRDQDGEKPRKSLWTNLVSESRDARSSDAALKAQNQQLLAAAQVLQADARRRVDPGGPKNVAQVFASRRATIAAAATVSARPERRNFKDQPGSGKPQTFSGKELASTSARKLEKYVASAYDDIRPSLAWTVAQDAQKTPEEIAANETDFIARQFSDIDEELYTSLSSLTEGESCHSVCVANGGSCVFFEVDKCLHYSEFSKWWKFKQAAARSLVRFLPTPKREKRPAKPTMRDSLQRRSKKLSL